jgi:hypothetical protein
MIRSAAHFDEVGGLDRTQAPDFTASVPFQAGLSDSGGCRGSTWSSRAWRTVELVAGTEEQASLQTTEGDLRELELVFLELDWIGQGNLRVAGREPFGRMRRMSHEKGGHSRPGSLTSSPRGGHVDRWARGSGGGALEAAHQEGR